LLTRCSLTNHACINDFCIEKIQALLFYVKPDPMLNFYRLNICGCIPEYTRGFRYFKLLKKQKPEFTTGIVELIYHYKLKMENDKAEKLVAEYYANKNFGQQKQEAIKVLYPDLVPDN
jgi:hypothetical protein